MIEEYNDAKGNEFVRWVVRLAPKTAQEIDSYAAMSGLPRLQFMPVALVAGARLLSRNLAPEQYITPDMMKGIIQAQMGNKEDIKRAVEELKTLIKIIEEASEK